MCASLRMPAAHSMPLVAALQANVNYFPAVMPNEIQLRRAAAELGVDNDDFDEFGHIIPKMPPLMGAIVEKNAEMVELLLENHADLRETGAHSTSELCGAGRQIL